MTATATAPTAPAHRVPCTHCPGTVSIDGQPVHSHHPSCSYWTLRCSICQTPLTGTHTFVPPHDERAELCFMCGDLLEVESHP